MLQRRRPAPLRLGDRARNKLNRRVGTIDAVEKVGDRLRYGLHYDEQPQDHWLATPQRDGASLPADLLERP